MYANNPELLRYYGAFTLIIFYGGLSEASDALYDHTSQASPLEEDIIIDSSDITSQPSPPR